MNGFAQFQDLNDRRPPILPNEFGEKPPLAPGGAIHTLGSAVFRADEEPGLLVDELMAVLGKLSYQPDYVTQDEADQHGLEARNLEKAVLLTKGLVADGANAEHTGEILTLFLTEPTQNFLKQVYSIIRPGEREEDLKSGAFIPVDAQGNRMVNKFDYIGRHEHGEAEKNSEGRSDITTVLVTRWIPGWGDEHVHHVIETTNAAGDVQEYSTPAKQGDLIVSDSRLYHRVPKIKSYETERITFAVNWKLVAG